MARDEERDHPGDGNWNHQHGRRLHLYHRGKAPDEEDQIAPAALRQGDQRIERQDHEERRGVGPQEARPVDDEFGGGIERGDAQAGPG